MSTHIGTCSICGGRVVTSEGADHDTPYCEGCCAIPKKPLMQMERPKSDLISPRTRIQREGEGL